MKKKRNDDMLPSTADWNATNLKIIDNQMDRHAAHQLISWQTDRGIAEIFYFFYDS